MLKKYFKSNKKAILNFNFLNIKHDTPLSFSVCNLKQSNWSQRDNFYMVSFVFEFLRRYSVSVMHCFVNF